ncbi:MAG: hypothetical protein VXZ39_08955, partial [Planctomycetota bacterium]|nr:hypothetical protein [Planctomycetota bacterium]
MALPMTTYARGLALVLSAASAVFLASPAPGATRSATTSASGDLAELFAPPTSDELRLVRADWATRPLEVEDYRLEATGLDGRGDTIHVLSHVVDGQRHYGALRFPPNYVPGGSYPLIVACHGGLSGVDLDEIGNVFSTFPGPCIDSKAFVLIPSYRGEDLVTPFAGTFSSGGTASWADRDVDDTRALLSAALENYPEIDEARIGAYGLSRGAAVVMLMSLRDARVRRRRDHHARAVPLVELLEAAREVDAVAHHAVLHAVGRADVAHPHVVGVDAHADAQRRVALAAPRGRKRVELLLH